MTVTEAITHQTAETRAVEAAGVDFAYRRFGRPTGLPLILLQHFRGNLDNRDPALTDALAAERGITLVDYPGVGGSTGEPSRTIAEMARRMIAFVDALGLDRIDLLGHVQRSGRQHLATAGDHDTAAGTVNPQLGAR